MKYLTAFIISLCVLVTAEGIAKANTYYFSSSSGDDSRTIIQAQNPATPWQSINKLNSILPFLAPGDSVLFKRGDTFYGAIKISISGLSSLPIVFSAYGDGSMPVITGLTTLTGWFSAGAGIQQSNCLSCKASDNVVVINGVLQKMGRYPNTGYLTYQSFSGNTSITSSQLTGAPNWQGAEVVIRKNHWILDRNKITSQSGNTINYNSASIYSGTKNFGFFIQNDPRTLDTLGEWYFDSANNNMMIYFGGNDPSMYDIKTSTVDTLVYLEGESNIIFDNLAFEGANQYDFLINSSNYITIQNCDFNNSGGEVLRCSGCNYFTLTHSFINHTLNNAIDLGYSSTNSTISNNIIKNTGYIAGMGGSGDGTYTAIIPGRAGAVIKNNEIDSTGYNAITFDGDGVKVEDNYVNTFCFIKDDGGGIYTYTGGKPLTYQERIVGNNIVINGIGAPMGANGNWEVHGIYLDDMTSQVTLDSNTVYNVNGSAIYLHRTNNTVITNNNTFNNNGGLSFTEENDGEFYNNTILHNKFVAESKSQLTLEATLDNKTNDIAGWGTIDSNYLSRPVDEDSIITVDETGDINKPTFMNLSQWQSYSSQDSHSKGAPVPVNDTSKILFRYNPTSLNQKIILNGIYIDFDGTQYSGSITLKPFSSVILIKISNSNSPPVANAGQPQTITLPLDSVTLDGSASYDPDGTIASWKWANQSGPAGYVINNSTASKTNVSGLIAGTYIFILTVTDNQGDTSEANVTIIVNKQQDTTVTLPTPPLNQLPVAKAGSNQIITLPVDSAILDGSSSYDPDGTIVSWKWIKSSGPSAFTINNDSFSKTEVTGLTTGTYIFTLTVTDNDGGTSSANDTIIVNKQQDTTVIMPAPPPNQPPVAKTGSNQIITLPVDSAILDGSASYDPDGTIVSWKWVKVSGPSAFAINNDSVSKTTVTGLTPGAYIFTLTIIDNQGVTSSTNDTILVNQPPVANAGSNTNLFLPDDSAVLDGSASYDPDGEIVSWAWSLKSGASAINILNADSSKAKVNQLVNGTYIFNLVVTDNDGAKDTTEVTVGVYQKPNQPPVANAGKDITIVLPQSSVTLDGTASYDPDGSIVKYHWSPMTGPTQANTLTPDSSTCFVSGLQMGTYDFQLTVTDNNGLSSTATVSVYVLPGQDTVSTTFHIYPNPAHDQLDVQIDQAITGMLTFRIIDVNGRILKIYQFGQLPMHVAKVLDISSLTPGIYFVQLLEDNQLGVVAKMIKY